MTRVLTSLVRIISRVLVVALGAAGVAWGAYALPPFWRQSPLEGMAKHIIAGDPYKTEALRAFEPAVEQVEQSHFCRPAARQAAAIIRLRLAEDAMAAGEQDRVDGALTSLREAIRRSIGCSPADPFLWVVLFWVENTVDGFEPGHMQYLRMSYRLGPNEGWIALKRSPLALALFDRLPPDLADMAVMEFANLLNSRFDREAVAIFTGPGWRARNRLLAGLKNVSEIARESFARALYTDGYDVDVPGIRRPDPRPWH